MAFELNRRQVLKGSVAFAATVGCARKPKPGGEPRVSILKADYGPGLHDKVRRLLLDHKLDVRGKRVLLKPNLVEFDPGAAINTNPLLVLAALEAFRSLGAASVGIAEGPGHRRVTLDLADAAGYYRTFPDFDKVFTDLNLDDVAQVRLPRSAVRLASNTMALIEVSSAAPPRRRASNWALVRMEVRGLLISCAMPAIVSPSEASFSD